MILSGEITNRSKYNSETSFQNVVKWKQDIDSKVFLKQSNDPIPVVVLANKVRNQI